MYLQPVLGPGASDFVKGSPLLERATLSPNSRSILCPYRTCQMQVGVARGDFMGLMKGYRLDGMSGVWMRDPLEQVRGLNKVPILGAVVRCWSCRGLMDWPFGEAAENA